MINNGITFKEDCLIGAGDTLERWVCKTEIPYVNGLAWKGVLTEVLIAIIAVIVFFVILLFVKKS